MKPMSIGQYEITYENGNKQVKELIRQLDFDVEYSALKKAIEAVNSNVLRSTLKSYMDDNYPELFFTTLSPYGLITRVWL